MSDRFIIDFIEAQSDDLKQYCKMENIILSSLLPVRKPKSMMKVRLESVACHLLQRVNNRLGIIISRLTADIEESGRVQRRLS